MSFAKNRYDAVVIGSGPNGMAAAIKLALEGLSVVLVEKESAPGGGVKTEFLTLPGYHHDVFSAVHPFAYASPFLKTLPLADFGLEWIFSEAQIAHPLDSGEVALLYRDVEQTAQALGKDAKNYRKLFEPYLEHFDRMIEEILDVPLHLPKNPWLFARFGLNALLSARALVEKYFKEEKSKALFMGIAAHTCAPLTTLASAAPGLALQLAAHGGGWPIPKGGASKLTSAMIAYFQSLGGELVTHFEVKDVAELPASDLVLMDLTPKQVNRVAGKVLPDSIFKSFSEYRYGPGVFKMDWALSEGIPWKNRDCAKAATVHLGNTAKEIIDCEALTNRAQITEKPYVLLAQPSLFDKSRVPEGKQLAWAYCHVPHASEIDMRERIENQIERFAPGFKDTILARNCLGPAELQSKNANLMGGDISGGLVSPRQLFFRPRVTNHPYSLGGNKYWICSSSTPPGPGVHGMSGYRAALAALKNWQKN